ncbi:hypothetical protein GV054_15320 [Marinomonas mediterranea]|uniref:hypothetical protein n=1 Tax=Marinomonas mediterranea TaxID=119864 RepID=UPI0023496926|nr:hypothetical protein [Marinomonas mediterranea]WCN14264.1 hypothetical protein GV054_15320 [Marinomonas mediterranea]
MKFFVGLMLAFGVFLYFFLGGHTTLNGPQYSYDIPNKWIENQSSILYSDEVFGDSSPSISLLFEKGKLAKLSSNEEVSVLIHFDRDYGSNDNLGATIFMNLSNTEKDPYDEQHYIKPSKRRRGGFYVSFDPVSETPDDSDFFVDYTSPLEITIGNETRIGKLTCVMKFFIEGMLVKLRTSDQQCNKTSYYKLHSNFISLLDTWKR